MKERKANSLCPELSLSGNISLVLWISLEGFISSLSLEAVFKTVTGFVWVVVADKTVPGPCLIFLFSGLRAF